MAMRALGFEPRREEIKTIISAHIEEGSDLITLDQFVTIMSGKIAEKGAREEIMKAFRLFDDDQSGKISFKNLKRVAQELGETLTDEELKEMIQEADQDNDGEVNQDEFLRIMKKTCLYWSETAATAVTLYHKTESLLSTRNHIFFAVFLMCMLFIPLTSFENTDIKICW